MQEELCPCCGRHCPLTDPHCDRGREYAKTGLSTEDRREAYGDTGSHEHHEHRGETYGDAGSHEHRRHGHHRKHGE